MSFVNPHQILTKCGSNPFEVNKTMIQARMLSGMYITDQLAIYWRTQNPAGFCLLPGCSNQTVGSLEHILLQCPAMHITRRTMLNICHDIREKFPEIRNFMNAVLTTNHPEIMVQFLLDCYTLPSVILLQQTFGPEVLKPLFYVSRRWCYSVHRKRMILLGLFQFI